MASPTFSPLQLPRWKELPDIELYMDQVISQLDKYLGALSSAEGEHLLTSSMINNYVKLKLLPAPTKKRYGRLHLAYLIAICLLKPTLRIPEIKVFLDKQFTDVTPQAYDELCEIQEQAYAAATKTASEDYSLRCMLQMAAVASANKAVVQTIINKENA